MGIGIEFTREGLIATPVITVKERPSISRPSEC